MKCGKSGGEGEGDGLRVCWVSLWLMHASSSHTHAVAENFSVRSV